MLPAAAALGAAIGAILVRFTRAAMLEVLGQDYVRTARAKGVARRGVVFRHALRNALIPVLAAAGVQAVYLIGGAVVIEEVFALPGVGRLVVNAIYQRDYTMIQGAVLTLTAVAVAVNLALDVLYHAIDPRIVYR
jgi:peptide/nickel transport system permease protein